MKMIKSDVVFSTFEKPLRKVKRFCEDGCFIRQIIRTIKPVFKFLGMMIKRVKVTVVNQLPVMHLHEYC